MVQKRGHKIIMFCAELTTRMVIHVQLVKPAICFSDLQACEEQIHSFFREKPNISLRQQTFLILVNPKFQLMIFTLANGHLIVYPSNVTLTFNLSEQTFQMNNCAKLF